MQLQYGKCKVRQMWKVGLQFPPPKIDLLPDHLVAVMETPENDSEHD
jgi:hypothetical protein